MISVKPPLRILLVAIVLGCGVDLLFYDKLLGISALLFVLLLMSALFGLGWMNGTRPLRRNLWMVFPLIYFSCMVSVRANSFVTSLNVVFSLLLLGLIARFYAAGGLEKLGLTGYLLVPFSVLGNALIRTGSLVSASVDLQSLRQRGGRSFWPLIRGILLALPILFVFAVLLSSADLVFANYLDNLFSPDILATMREILWRGIIILAAAWIIAGGFAYALNRGDAERNVHAIQGNEDVSESAQEKESDGQTRLVSFGFIEVATVLILVDLLFAVFVWIQFAYLFGGRANVVGEGFTYAEYARRGFFELMAVSLLSLGLILSLRWLLCGETSRQKRAFGALCSLMVALVLVILISAFQRLRLYEAAYGYTHLRLYSHIFMIWLAVTFVWLLIVIWNMAERFAIGAFASALGFLVTLNIINPDAFIVKQNLALYQSIGKLDANYLGRLSEDAVPVLMLNIDQINGYERNLLSKSLLDRLILMEEDTRWRSWPSFHLARRRAYNLLAGNRERLKSQNFP